MPTPISFVVTRLADAKAPVTMTKRQAALVITPAVFSIHFHRSAIVLRLQPFLADTAEQEDFIAAISSEPELCRPNDPIFRRNVHGAKSHETCEEGTYDPASHIYGYNTVEASEADDVSRR